MGEPAAEHLSGVYKMYGEQDNEQGQQRVAKELAAIGLTPAGKPAKREDAAAQRQAHAEQATKPAEPGATGTAGEDAEPDAKDKGDARHEPPAGRHTPTRHQGTGGRP